MELDFLPLKTNAHIMEGNALRMDWLEVCGGVAPSYICGNPPFRGASMMSKEQKADAVAIFGKGNRINSIDYVGAWYYLAAKLIKGSTARCAFVSTNSITQGEQVAPMWGKLFSEYNIQLIFAHISFVWENEAQNRAAVHCVVIGFVSGSFNGKKYIYNENVRTEAVNISPYIIDAPSALVESRGAPLCNAPRMTKGNQPSDGGNLILTKEERNVLIEGNPALTPCIRRYVGSKGFINNNEERYCLWLKGVSPTVYAKDKAVTQRLAAVREMRLKSSAAPTRALADKPYLFFSTPQTESNYLAIPEVSSERRKYIPIGFMDKSVIASNKLLIIPDATLYHFGILTSNVHMGWVRTVAGRMKSDYSYSGASVYNPFPWPSPTEEQRRKVEKTAQGILDARSMFPDASMAVLYNELTMPPELRKAHQLNDKAVMEAYGIGPKDEAFRSESACVAFLMKLYQEMTEKG